MDNSRRGSGIFLGIVSIATLIVAIIGATFAYFSASTESNEGAIGLQAYEYKLTLSVIPIYPEGASALIPLNPTTKIKTNNDQYIKLDESGSIVETALESEGMNNLQYAINAAKKRCIDDNGMQVCALYQVIINNESPNEVILSGQIETTSNIASTKPNRTPFKNLTYQDLKGSHDDSTLELVGEPVTLAEEVGTSVKIGNIKVPGGTTNAMGDFEPGVGSGYILVYLNDFGDQTGEMGASMTGKLKYASQDGLGTTLTGMFKVSITEPEPEPEPDPEPDPAEPTE